MSESPFESASEPAKTPKASIFKHLREWVVLILVALMLSLSIRDFAFQTFFIPSGSMEPTLQVGDRIVVDKLAVSFGTIHRGDVIVFRAPAAVASACGDHDQDLVKRVVALPGDRVSSSGNNIVVNGHVLNENWPHFEPLGPSIKATTVPAGNYFVIGDNHGDSCDSRYWGTVPRGNIIGKVFVKIWPLGRFGWL